MNDTISAMLSHRECNCAVDVTNVTPDSIRAEQEKVDADEG